MIRTLITPEQQDVSIPIPQNFVGRQIEVLLYAIDELTEEDKPEKKRPNNTMIFKGT